MDIFTRYDIKGLQAWQEKIEADFTHKRMTIREARTNRALHSRITNEIIARRRLQQGKVARG